MKQDELPVKTLLLYRAAAHDAFRIVRAQKEGSRMYAKRLREKHLLGARMEPIMEKYYDKECMAAAISKTIDDFAEMLKCD